MSSEINQNKGLSKRQILKGVYDPINETAKPGDIVFFISEGPKSSRLQRLKQMYRGWQGFCREDNSRWHTAVLVNPEKESQGAQWRPHFVHAVTEGVQKTHITPSFFNTEYSPNGEALSKARIEIIQNSDLTDEQRERIVCYALNQIGRPFAPLDWHYILWTITLGLPSSKLDLDKPDRKRVKPDSGVSCHGLAFCAYAQVGFDFPHHMENAPIFNIGRWLGHPLGHSARAVDLSRIYLTDHYLYRDPRFESIIAVSEDNATKLPRAVLNPGKYSWNPRFREVYRTPQVPNFEL